MRRRIPTPSARTVLNAALAVVALLAFAILVSRIEESPGIEIERRDPPGQIDTLRVHVSGAVVAPGVVSLAPGDRVVDAIEAAGGASADAAPDRVNLARRVVDGEQIHVPRTGDPPDGGLVDLNTASAADLEALPGIGAARSRAIIAARQAQPFVSSDDLVTRGILPPDVYEAIRDRVTTGAPAP